MNAAVGYCALCGKNQTVKERLTARDFLLSREEFSIVQCTVCGLHLTHPQISEESIGRYYAFGDYAPYRGIDGTSFIGRVRRLIRTIIPEKETARIVSRLREKGVNRILEIGPGAGDLSRILARAGFEVSAVELDPSCAERLKGFGIDCVSGTVAEGIKGFDAQRFDAVIMRHVFEHLYHPRAVLQSLRKILTDSGIILLSMPDASSREASFFGSYWMGWEVPRHVAHYDPRTLTAVLSLEGFATDSVVPEYFGTSFIDSIELFVFSKPAPGWFHHPLYYLWCLWAPIHFRLFGSGTMSAVVRKSETKAVPRDD